MDCKSKQPKHSIASLAIPSIYGNGRYVRTIIAILVGQYKKHMNAQILIEIVFPMQNGKILPYLCMPVPVIMISLIYRTSKSL